VRVEPAKLRLLQHISVSVAEHAFESGIVTLFEEISSWFISPRSTNVRARQTVTHLLRLSSSSTTVLHETL
jgi:hypothetical protein